MEGTYVGHEGMRRFVADTVETFEVFNVLMPTNRPDQVDVNIDQPTGSSQPSAAPVDSSFMITAFC